MAILTKVGHEMGPGKKGLSRRYIKAEVEDSLKRLKIDSIDLYQSHRDDEATPMLETLETYAELIREGKVRAIGASNFSAARLAGIARCGARARPAALRMFAAARSISMTAPITKASWNSFASRKISASFPITGSPAAFSPANTAVLADFGKSPRGGRMKDYLNEKGRKILAALDAVAAAHNVKPAAVALAWLIARPSITAPIASATSVEQLKDFSAAAALKLCRPKNRKLDRR